MPQNGGLNSLARYTTTSFFDYQQGPAAPTLTALAAEIGESEAETAQLLADNFSSPERVKPMLDYYRALIRGGGARRQSKLGFPVIETPTLMIWGVNDVALTVRTTYPTSKYVRDLTLRYLPEASHFVQQDAPVLVNRLLAHWLRGEPVPEEGEAEGVHVATRA